MAQRARISGYGARATATAARGRGGRRLVAQREGRVEVGGRGRHDADNGGGNSGA